MRFSPPQSGLVALFLLSVVAAAPLEARPRAAATSASPSTSSPAVTPHPVGTISPPAGAAPSADPFTGSTPARPTTAFSVVSDATRQTTDIRSSPPATVTAARTAMTPYLYGCNKAQQSVVMQAWSEAGILADAHAQWTPPTWYSGGTYQPAMDMYLGTDSRYDDPWFGTGPLRQNINRQQGIHTANKDWSPWWSYAYFYCDESQVPAKPNAPTQRVCGQPDTPDYSVAAYTFSDDGSIFGWNAKYVVLCPRFFADDILTLEQQTNNAKSSMYEQTTIDSWLKVGAHIIFHETYHWGPDEVSDPRCNLQPEVYDPLEVVQLAKNENVPGSKTNAESWALAAIACYVQQTFNLKNPPAPDSSLSTNVGDDLQTLFFDTPPDWFQPPVSLDASNFAPANDSDSSFTSSDSASPTTSST